MDFNPKAASESLLSVLPKRTANVLEKRFGLVKSGKRFTLEAIGQSYGITRERVRQIERDGLHRIKKSRAYAGLNTIFDAFHKHIKERGGIMAEERLVAQFDPDGASGNAVRFLLAVSPLLICRSETDTFHSRWGEDPDTMDNVEEALGDMADYLLPLQDTISYDDLTTRLSQQLAVRYIKDADPQQMQVILAISKSIGINYFGQWGHTSSPLVRPRGVKDLAYLVFQKEGTPMHFSAAADRIRAIAAPRHVHPQTVHNELIKDPRFVLVGRGMYGLTEWGFESGTVRDIIVRVLQENPRTREDIIQAVMNKRQVKENTILINLQNRKHFAKFPDGTYGNVISS